MTTQETFKETLEELGFAGHKPNQMTNSDYWLCTTTAMENHSLKVLEGFIIEWYKNNPSVSEERCKEIAKDYFDKINK